MPQFESVSARLLHLDRPPTVSTEIWHMQLVPWGIPLIPIHRIQANLLCVNGANDMSGQEHFLILQGSPKPLISMTQ